MATGAKNGVKIPAIISLILSCILTTIAIRILWESFQMFECRTHVGLEMSSEGVSCKYAGLAGIVLAAPGLNILIIAIICSIIAIVKKRKNINPSNSEKIIPYLSLIICTIDLIIVIISAIIGWVWQ